MASLNGRIDPDAGVPGDFEVFEAGIYPLEFIESDIKATKAGTGTLLTYKLRITEGDLIERLIFGQLNLENPNPIATKIGQEEFRAIREVTQTLEPEDTQDLHFKQFMGVVKLTPAKGDYKAKNEVDWAKTYKLFSGEEVAAPVAANDNVAGKAPANDNKPAAKPAAAKPVTKAAWPRKAA